MDMPSFSQLPNPFPEQVEEKAPEIEKPAEALGPVCFIF